MIARLSPWVVAAALVAATACGSKSTSDNSQTTTPSAPKATSLALDVLPVLKISKTTKATATVTFDDGTVSTTAATITSDATTIASVSASGVVTGLKAGTANITASVTNRSSTQNLRVIPDVNGIWNGSAVQTSCTASSGLTCQPNGFSTSFTINIGQNDGTVPTAFLSIGGAAITLGGVISIDGTLTLSGQASISDPGFDMLKVQNWTATFLTEGVMAGSFQVAALKNGAQVVLTSFTIQNATR